MSKELHCLNINATAEFIRYLLHYTNQKFKDVKHDFDSWPNEAIKDSPLYKEGSRILDQSLAIAKYVARGTDLIPSDPWDQAVLDNIVYTIYDYWSNVSAYIKEKDMDKKQAMKKKILEETIDFFFSKFEKYLKENDGFFIGKLSWVEFVLCGLVEASDLFLGVEVAKNYPTVSTVVEKIRNLPGVKEHIITRGPYELPIKSKENKGQNILKNIKA